MWDVKRGLYGSSELSELLAAGYKPFWVIDRAGFKDDLIYVMKERPDETPRFTTQPSFAVADPDVLNKPVSWPLEWIEQPALVR